MKLKLICLFLVLTVFAAASEPTVLPLWPEGVPGAKAGGDEEKGDARSVTNVHRPTLTISLPPAGQANGTAIVICPGGGYTHLAVGHEGADIAAWFNARGVTAFVLRYRLAAYGQPAPLQDVLRAIRIVRSRAAEFGVAPDRIGVMGFSAGGHLAASAATLYDLPAGRTGAELDKVSGRPDFALLIYPVITMKDPYTHAGSRRALLGEKPTPELIAQWSVEDHVTAQTPPTFIMQTQEDKTVPLQNALLFYEALCRAKVPAELHIYEKGPHGIGMKHGFGATSEWPKPAEGWLATRGLLPAVAAKP